VSDVNALDEIWASGLRNPWRFSFDRLTGDMWIGDVGQNLWEEIDFEPFTSTGGLNYGWRCYEGNEGYNLTDCGPIENYTFPVFELTHSPHCSVTGGFVYRGLLYPELAGHYLFTDFCSGEFFSLTPDGFGGFQSESLGVLQGNCVTFGEATNGELYVAAYGGGTIYKIQEDTLGDLHTGDVNADGVLSSEDAQLAFLITLSSYIPNLQEELSADCDGNGTVSSGDAQNIFLGALHLASCLDPII